MNGLDKMTRNNVIVNNYKNILDSVVSIGIYVITESEHKILYFNNRVKEVAPKIKLGDVCHEVWDGYCENCPLHKIGGKSHASAISYDDPFGKEVDIIASRILWDNEIPAFLICVYPRFESESNSGNKLEYVEPSYDITNCAYEIDEEFHIVSFSNAIKRKFPQMDKGKYCYECLMRKNAPCVNCPILVDNKEINSIVGVEIVERNGKKHYVLKFANSMQSDIAMELFGDNSDITNCELVSEEVGSYSVLSFYSDKKDCLPDNHNEILTELLRYDRGDGVIAGEFDDNLTIHFIDTLALNILKYPSYSIFKKETRNAMKSLLNGAGDYSKEKVHPGMRMNQILAGYQGIEIPVGVVCQTVTAKNGKNLWYVAIQSLEDNYIDHLTGGCTRLGFITQLEQMRVKGIDLTQYVIMYLNVVGFKAINELYTINGGDKLLQIIHEMIVRSKLQPVLSGRVENDHFIALIEKKYIDEMNFKELQDIMWKYGGKEVHVHAQCGLYYIENSRMAISGMIDRARLAKDYIVNDNVQPYAVYDKSMKNDYINHAEVISQYRDALNKKQFKVYYQPVVDAKTEKVISAEALIRWVHPEKGMISPGIFIPILEQNGCISKVDEFMNQEVARFLKTRNENDASFVPVSVNLSGVDFNEEKFIHRIIEETKKLALPKDSIRYEITETSYTALEKNKVNILENLKKQGIRILLDDFGSGVSTFGMIQKYDFDIVKLDMSFIRQIEENDKVHAIIRAIITMCHGLGIKVVAEGVETSGQLKFLRESDCDYIQGYYFAKPMPEDEFINYLEREQG